jgi:hypothetical protein
MNFINDNVICNVTLQYNNNYYKSDTWWWPSEVETCRGVIKQTKIINVVALTDKLVTKF